MGVALEAAVAMRYSGAVVGHTIYRGKPDTLLLCSIQAVVLVVPVAAADAPDEPDDEAGDEHHAHHDQHDDHPRLQTEAAVVEQLAAALVVVEC
jgi:hypothetical protein